MNLQLHKNCLYDLFVRDLVVQVSLILGYVLQTYRTKLNFVVVELKFVESGEYFLILYLRKFDSFKTQSICIPKSVILESVYLPKSYGKKRFMHKNVF